MDEPTEPPDVGLEAGNHGRGPTDVALEGPDGRVARPAGYEALLPLTSEPSVFG